MNQVVLDAMAPSAAGPADASAPGVKSTADDLGAELFRATLTTTLGARPPVAVAPTQPAQTSALSADDQALQTLAAKIAKMMNAGASPADIIKSLATQLASSVAQKLGTSSADARHTLQTLFASALAPPGVTDSDGASFANRAAALAQRYARLTTAADSIASQQLGQQTRIAGNLLDAQRAKDIPAQLTTTTNPAGTAVLRPGAGIPKTGKLGSTAPASDANVPAVGDAQSSGAAGQIEVALAAASLPGLAPSAPNATPLTTSAGDLSTGVPPINVAGAGTPLKSAASAAAGNVIAKNTIARTGANAAAAIPNQSSGTTMSDDRNTSLRIAIAGNAPKLTATVTAPAGDQSTDPAVLAGNSHQRKPKAESPGASVIGLDDSTADADNIAIVAPIAAAVGTPAMPTPGPDVTGQTPSSDGSSLAANAIAILPTAITPIAGAKASGDVSPIKRAVRAESTSDKSTLAAAGPKPLGPASASDFDSTQALPTNSASTVLPADSATSATSSSGAGPTASAPDSSGGLSSGDVPPAAPGGGDGRTVNLGSTAATQTGGDTVLGRTLTRAALAADARPAPIAVDASPVPAATDTAASQPVAPDPAVAAFVKAFEVALKAGAPAEVTRLTQRDPQAPSPLSLPTHEAASSATPFAPTVAPFTIDRADAAAPPAWAPAPTPVDHSAIADQVLRGAFMRNVGQSSEIRLTLTPESLGDVSVKLVVDAGSVIAHVVADTPEVRDALITAQPQLTKSLADSGLKLTSFTVDLQGNGFAGFSGQNDQSQQNNRSFHSANSAPLGDSGGDDMGTEETMSFGPASVTKLSAGNYNYLV
jgi:flagellar hook-length control protein FliK